jgi:hypothetical protein
MTARKHQPKGTRGARRYVYDGRRFFGIIEQQQNGAWATIMLGAVTGTYKSREEAIAAVGRICAIKGGRR